MSNATFTFGRFNPPTESGHGKLVSAVQSHAESTGGKHYIFPSHTQDSAKNPLSHSEKVGAMKKMFKGSNIVSHSGVRTAIDAVKHLESKGHTNVTMVVGSDRVKEFHGLLNKYRKKEFPKVKKVNVISAGDRDPDSEGAEGMSASKLRGLVKSGKRDEFISHYSDKKLGAQIHDKVKKAMNEQTNSPIGIFLLGGPGSGKDYVLKNILSRFDFTEVQLDQVLSGNVSELTEANRNIVINGAADVEKISIVESMLPDYIFDCIYVSVTNKVSRMRNEQREQPLNEQKRLEKWFKSEKLAEEIDCFVFNNSINLNESSDLEKVLFAGQIEKLLERLVSHGLVLSEKKFPAVAKDKESGLPKKYVAGLSPSTAKARASHWKKMAKYSDKDPRAYKPAPGDATAKTKPSKHTIAVRKMMDEAEETKIRRVARSGNITAVKVRQKENTVTEGADKSLSAKAAKSGVSLSTLRKVYRRGVAAWNSGHRPGTTPSQWGHARVNSYINKGKTYHTADKDLREETDINDIFEAQLVGTDEYRKHAIAMTPGQGEPVDAFPVKSPNKKPVAVPAKPGKSIVSQYTEEHTNCGTPNCCGECSEVAENASGSGSAVSFSSFRKSIKEATKENDGKEDGVDTTPSINTKKPKKGGTPGKQYNADLDGLPVLTARFTEETTLEEAVQYHLENKISFTENVFRPGSDKFFEMIMEAKRLYAEGKYQPKDDWERDMLNSDIGERVEFEGEEVILDYPFDELDEACWTGYKQVGMKKKGDRMVPNCVKEESDPTNGKGVGKPWREGGGGAVYVRDGGSIRKVRFSQSGMKKKYMDPGATRSFVARHHCLTNKDKTSASYWACRWPRFFSNSGKTWW